MNKMILLLVTMLCASISNASECVGDYLNEDQLKVAKVSFKNDIKLSRSSLAQKTFGAEVKPVDKNSSGYCEIAYPDLSNSRAQFATVIKDKPRKVLTFEKKSKSTGNGYYTEEITFDDGLKIRCFSKHYWNVSDLFKEFLDIDFSGTGLIGCKDFNDLEVLKIDYQPEVKAEESGTVL